MSGTYEPDRVAVPSPPAPFAGGPGTDTDPETPPTPPAASSWRKRREPRLFGRRYPWKEWFALPQFTVYKGIDYAGRTYTFAQQVRNAAGPSRHNVPISILIHDDGNGVTVFVGEQEKKGLDLPEI